MAGKKGKKGHAGSLIRTLSGTTRNYDSASFSMANLGVTGDFNVNLEKVTLEVEAELRKEEENRISAGSRGQGLLREALDISSTLEEGVSAIVDDSFTKCFNKANPTLWNFNAYLFPFWFLGVLVRYLVLFPVRLVWLLGTFVGLNICFALSRLLLPRSAFKFKLERIIVRLICFCWVASWSAVITCHGPKPTASKGRVWVSNHTSMIDWLVLSQITPFATVMQKHPGWLGLVQTFIMDGFGW